MVSKFRFISNQFELPMLDHNEEWLTNTWVYCIAGMLGALSGLMAIPKVMTGWPIGEAALLTVILGAFIIPVMWGGCTATAFFEIPELKFAFRRSLFNLVALTLVFFVCAILSVVAVVVLIIIVIGLIASGTKGSGKRSKADDTPGEVYDENGNVHYVNSSIGSDRVTTTDGDTMRRGADGTYRKLND